eukprot:g646.t1
MSGNGSCHQLHQYALEEALEQFLRDAHKALGGVDILVNNASSLSLGDDDKAWEKGFSIDLMSAVRATRICVPWMAEKGGGSVVHIGSISGLEAYGGQAAYSAAKAALLAHSKQMAVDYANSGIRVNTVCPGSIDFPGGLWDQIRQANPAMYNAVVKNIPGGRMGRPEE